MNTSRVFTGLPARLAAAVMLTVGPRVWAERTLVDIIVGQGVKAELHRYTDTRRPLKQRQAEIEELGARGDAQSVRTLMALGSADAYVKVKAIESLGEIGGGNGGLAKSRKAGIDVAAYLRDKLDHPEPGVVCAAIRSLARVEGTRALGDVGEFLDRNRERIDGFQGVVLPVGVKALADIDDPHSVALLSNALDANHYYRTGKSRLPHKARVHSCATGDNGYCRGTSAGETWAAEALDTWKTSEAVDPDGLAGAVFELGGDILDETSYGSNSSYAKGSVSITKLHQYGCNIRFVPASSCRTGGLGGVTNTQNIVDGTHNVLSIGATGGLWQPGFRIMESSDRSFRSRINSGMPRGKALVASYTFSRQSQKMTIMYGDLSLSSNTGENEVAPENGIPTISLLRPVPGRPIVGEPVRFTAVVDDPDGDPLEIEWFVGETRDAATEYVLSNVTDDTVTFSYSYGETGTARPYVVVRDPWMTGGRSERLELKVGDPAEVNLKTLVSALDPGLMLVAESTEDKALVRVDSAGEDQRHVWDMEPYRYGRFRFRSPCSPFMVEGLRGCAAA